MWHQLIDAVNEFQRRVSEMKFFLRPVAHAGSQNSKFSKAITHVALMWLLGCFELPPSQ